MDPVEATVLADGVRLAQVTDAAGMQKTIEVHLAADGPQVTVVQSIKNNGPWPVETYPWGLTQVRPGGFAVLPQWTNPLDRYGLVCNRSLAIWPYTRIN